MRRKVIIVFLVNFAWSILADLYILAFSQENWLLAYLCTMSSPYMALVYQHWMMEANGESRLYDRMKLTHACSISSGIALALVILTRTLGML
jgi:hypothetical protein